MRITNTRLKQIIKVELGKALKEFTFDTRHGELECCDLLVPEGIGRNDPEFVKCLEHPDAYARQRGLEGCPDSAEPAGPEPEPMMHEATKKGK